MKLYKNTLIISVIVFLICVLLSCVFELTCISRLPIIAFLSDYMIGIACSIIVVIITTFLQFKYEQKKLLNSILQDVQSFLFYYVLIAISLNPDEQASSKSWEYYYDEVYGETKKISLKLSDVEWFSKKNSKIAFNLRKAVLNIMVDLAKPSVENKKKALMDTLQSSWLKEINDNALLLANYNEYVAKEIKENYKKIELELKSYNTKKVDNKCLGGV